MAANSMTTNGLVMRQATRNRVERISLCTKVFAVLLCADRGNTGQAGAWPAAKATAINSHRSERSSFAVDRG